MRIPAPLERVIFDLSRLPGVGEKTATRFAFHLLGGSPEAAAELGTAIRELHDAVRQCTRCHGLAEGELCDVCQDPRRDATRLCVTEGIPELLAVERTGEYRGRYHVLHGVLSPVKGIGPDALTLDSLLRRIPEEGVTEVILATNVDVEGEATALYVQRLVARLGGVSVTRLATGIPMGGDLEYLDQVTLARALRDRRVL